MKKTKAMVSSILPHPCNEKKVNLSSKNNSESQELVVTLVKSQSLASVKAPESKCPVTLILPSCPKESEPNLSTPIKPILSSKSNIKCATCANLMGLAKVSEGCVETSNLGVEPNTPCASDLKKLTVPHMIVAKLAAGERHACQRSHSTAGVVCRPVLNRAEHDNCSGRCISLSPANSFRDRQMSARFRVAFNTNKIITSSNTPFGFPRSTGNDIICKPDGMDSHPRIGAEVFERPSPDHDMGSSPRG